MFGTSSIPPDPKALAAAVAELPEPQLRFNLVIQKTPGASLGIDVAYNSSTPWTRSGVFISKVIEGSLVDAWNARRRDPHRVQPGDFIFQVNNVLNDPLSIIQEIMVKQTLTIYIMRWQHPPVPTDHVAEPTVETADIDARPGLTPSPCSTRWRSPGPLETQSELPKFPHAYPPDHLVSDFAESAAVAPEGNHLSPRVEALLPQLAQLGDEALASLLRVVLEHRQLPRDALLGNA